MATHSVYAINVRDVSAFGRRNETLSGNESVDTADVTADIIGVGFVAVPMILLSMVTIVGNVLVVLSIFTYKPLRNVQNFFLVSLAVSDLAVAILVMPFHVSNYILGYWIFGPIFCDIWLTCDVLCCTASILNICAIALDRYRAIHDPINYARMRTMKRVEFIIAIVWLLSSVISVPPLFGWNSSGKLYDEELMICHLTDAKGYVIYSACGSFFIPLVIMIFVYLKIFLATRRRLRERAKSNLSKITGMKWQAQDATIPPEPTSQDTSEEIHDLSDCSNKNNKKESYGSTVKNGVAARHKKETTVTVSGVTKTQEPQKSYLQQFWVEKQKISLSKERKAARTLGIIMGSFILCWLPFFLMYIILPFCASCSAPSVEVETFIVWLGYINSGLNPVIYTIFNIDFRKAFQLLLFGKCTRSSLMV